MQTSAERRAATWLWRRVARWGLLPIVVLALAGCQSIPDVSGWTQATRDVSAAVTSGAQAAAGVNAELASRLAAIPGFAEPAKRYTAVAETLAQRSVDYETLFGALADYAGALAALSQASQDSAKTVDAVAGSVNQLLGAVGGTALAGAGFELGKALASEAIKIKAARNFADAVERADPVIARIADLLAADLADLGKTVGETKRAAVIEAFELPHLKRLDYRRALERRRTDLQAVVRTAVAPPPPAPGAPPPATVSILNAADAPELARVEQFLRDTDAWFNPMQADIARALKTQASTLALTAQVQRAVLAWKASHASLAAAVRERRAPESGRLAALALRIRDLAADLKKEQ